MDFWFFVLPPFLAVLRTTHVTARIAALLAERTVRAGILLQQLLIHAYILQPSQLRIHKSRIRAETEFAFVKWILL
jgi:hypothetical protein